MIIDKVVIHRKFDAGNYISRRTLWINETLANPIAGVTDNEIYVLKNNLFNKLK